MSSLKIDKQYIFNLIKILRKRDLCLQLGNILENIPFNISKKQCLKLKDYYGTKGINGRVFHQALEQYLRKRIEPVQAMFSTWMQGAKAQVEGKDIPFSQIIVWCQDQPDNKKRHILRNIKKRG